LQVVQELETLTVVAVAAVVVAVVVVAVVVGQGIDNHI
jgi:hypothetical protein